MPQSSSGRGFGEVVALVIGRALAEPGRHTTVGVSALIGEPVRRVQLAVGEIEAAGWVVVRHGQYGQLEFLPAGSAIVV